MACSTPIGNPWCAMKIDIDLKAGFLQELKREVLANLTPAERARQMLELCQEVELVRGCALRNTQ